MERCGVLASSLMFEFAPPLPVLTATAAASAPQALLGHGSFDIQLAAAVIGLAWVHILTSAYTEPARRRRSAVSNF